MAKGKGHIVPHARRRKLKTNYVNRLKLLRSGKPRLVVRKSLKNMLCQVVEYEPSGDRCLVSADSRELKGLGWLAGRGNVPAAYLTGLLCGIRAKKKKIGGAVLDTGMQTSAPGGRLYAALKGVLDSGLSVAHSKGILPDGDRSKGAHIASYSEWLKKESSEEYGKRFSSYIKSKVAPESLPEHFAGVRDKMLKSK